MIFSRLGAPIRFATRPRLRLSSISVARGVAVTTIPPGDRASGRRMGSTTYRPGQGSAVRGSSHGHVLRFLWTLGQSHRPPVSALYSASSTQRSRLYFLSIGGDLYFVTGGESKENSPGSTRLWPIIFRFRQHQPAILRRWGGRWNFRLLRSSTTWGQGVSR